MKTAVEFLWDRLFEIKKTIPFDEQTEAILKAYHKAKEMEKEQIIDSFGVGCQVESTRLIGYQDIAEQYYNETFKSE